MTKLWVTQREYNKIVRIWRTKKRIARRNAMLDLYILEGKTLAEIGQQYGGLSRQRVAQIIAGDERYKKYRKEKKGQSRDG